MAGPSLSPVDQLGSTFKDYAVSHRLAGALDHQITIRNPWDPSTAAHAVAYNWSLFFFSLFIDAILFYYFLSPASFGLVALLLLFP